MVDYRDTRSPHCFEELYACSRSALLSWILHLCATRRLRVDPAELLQDTYVNVYRYAGGFSEADGASFHAWARAIAANVVRRASTRSRLLSLGSLPDGTQEPTDPRPGPDLALCTGEQDQALRRTWALLLLQYANAHQRLGPRDQLALDLIEVQGYTYGEAGRLLRVGRSNMKMIMFRARNRLRAHMGRALEAGLEGASNGSAARRRRAG